MDVVVYFTNRQKQKKVTMSLRLLMKKAVHAVLQYEDFRLPSEVSITFVDNAQIRELNCEYREKDAATDVLSFPLIDFYNGETPNPEVRVGLGDIVISLEKATEQAAEFGHSFDREAAFLCVHSMLHLLGYDHERSSEEEETMCRKQREIMNSIGL